MKLLALNGGAHINEVVQLKLLQTIVTILTTCEIHDKTLSNALLICFKLHQKKEQKNLSVISTASASIRQLVTMIFDNATLQIFPSFIYTSTEKNLIFQKLESAETMEEMPLIFADAYRLLNDLCQISIGDSSNWLLVENIENSFSLELIESILSKNNSLLFIHSKHFKRIVTDRICPLIFEFLKTKNDFKIMSRVLKIVCNLLSHYNTILVCFFFFSSFFFKNCDKIKVAETEVFISKLIRFLESDNNLWLHTLVLEIFHSIIQSPGLLLLFYTKYDLRGNPFFLFLIIF